MIGRRRFLAGACALATVAGGRAFAEETVVVGLVLPAAGDAGAKDGAALGLTDANALATLFGTQLRLHVETVADAASAATAVRALAQMRAIAIIGASSPEPLVASAGDDAVVLNVGDPAERLRQERCARSAFHLIPSIAMYVDALAEWIVTRRTLPRWAVEADGSPRGREIEAAAQRALARRSGTLVAGGAESDVVLLAVDRGAEAGALERVRARGRDADRVIGIGADAPLSLPADQAAGTWAAGWHHDATRFGARELNARFRRRFNGALTESGWSAWAALKLVGEAVVRGGARDPASLRRFIESAPPFDGHKGEALSFRAWDHQLRQPMQIVAPRKRDEAAPARGPFAVVADVGTGRLDSLGTPAPESRCRLTS